MKVLIAGAGIGGLVAAGRLADLGLDVEVIEKSTSIETMRYDWHDDVAPKIFRRVGIEIPKEHWKKGSWTFCTTGEAVVREFQQDETDPDLSIERIPLNQTLANYATSKGAKIRFGAKVQAPIVKDGRVCGLVIDGKEEEADFVLDSAGAYSPIRSNLPEEFKIAKLPGEDEVFEVYRAFVRKNDGFEDAVLQNKVYMKHLNKPGISWAIPDVSDATCMNVLVGKVCGLSDEDLKEGLEDLRKFNPVLSEEVVRGGYKVRIPVRYPLTRMVADGYAVIGDAAFMTIPMLGSGIASSMLSATLLAETIGESMTAGIKDGSMFDAKNLWGYQVKVYQEFGYQHLAVDIMKRWMLTCDFLDWLFGSKILSNSDLVSAASGQAIKLTAKFALQKMGVIKPKDLGKVLKMMPMLLRSNKAGNIGKRIPKKYVPRAIECWEKKVFKIIEKSNG